MDAGTPEIRSVTKSSSFPPASRHWHTGDHISYKELFLPSSQWTLAYRGSDQVKRALPSLQLADAGTPGIRSDTKSSSFPLASRPWHIGDQIRSTGLFLPPGDPGTLGIRSGPQGSSFPPASGDSGTSGIRSGTQGSSFPPASGDPGTSGIRSGTQDSSFLQPVHCKKNYRIPVFFLPNLSEMGKPLC